MFLINILLVDDHALFSKSLEIALSDYSEIETFDSICNETKNNISHVKTCFDQIIFFLQNDVQTQFTELVQETQDYYQSIQEIQVIISEIAEESETFVNTVQNIQNQIHAISDVPDSDHISSQDILEKARQTEETTQEMSVIVNHNKENALEINNIVERFS